MCQGLPLPRVPVDDRLSERPLPRPGPYVLPIFGCRERHGLEVRPTDMHPLRQAAAALCLLATAALSGGCGLVVADPSGESPATWDLAPDQALTAQSTTFTALVARAECNSGVTGEANAPDIEVTNDQLVITFTVSPGSPPLGADCQGVDKVPYEVTLPEAIGDRSLVDGECASSDLAGTDMCSPNGVRYTADS